MVELWYFNSKIVDCVKVESLLKHLPLPIVNEVMRLKYHENRRLKLLGKLLVKKYYEDAGLKFNWNNWVIASEGKPYYKLGKKFNISHSGEYIVVGFSDNEIGVDIEKVEHFDVVSLSTYFHSEEIKYINSVVNQTDAFFRLWTRKEAYLKAVGKGIVNGIHGQNCLLDEIRDTRVWFLYSLEFIPNYKIAVCAQVKDCKIKIQELFLDEFA